MSCPITPKKQPRAEVLAVKMASQPLPKAKTRKCPMNHQTTNPEDLEHDFTTPGKIGNLSCPFAKLAGNGLPDTPDSQPDPIAAEFHQDKASTASATGLGQCPIRFLDKHSPEEIAQYFQNHKHEIPRSHEICVKRYQQNEQGIRQLDAKYGNLVNMIQGLGNKHKQYLPEADKSAKAKSSSAGIEKWAEEVSEKGTLKSATMDDDKEEPRLSRSEKPLREIRLGESPSRPWGIPVPLDKEAASSASEAEINIAKHEARIEYPPTPARVESSKVKAAPKVEKPKITTSPQISADEPQTKHVQILFNGPVFFGYSPEQAAVFLQSLGLSNPGPGSS